MNLPKVKGCLTRKKINGKPSGQYYTQFRSKHLPGGKLVQPTGTQDWNEANAIRAQRAQDISKGVDLKARTKLEGVMLADVLNGYLISLKTRGKKDLRNISRRANKVSSHPVFLHLRARDVTSEHGERYRNARRKDSSRQGPIKDSTIDHELGVLVSALNRAKQKGHISVTPFIEMARPKNKRQGRLSIEQFDKVFPYLCDSMKVFLFVDYNSGCRREELLKTGIRDVNFDDDKGYIQLREYETKTDKPRIIPFWGEMRKWILWQKAVHDAECPESPDLFFWHRADQHRGTNIRPGMRPNGGTVLAHWRRALKAAHASHPSIPTHLTVHDLRRSACSNMLQVFKFNLPTTMEISGHECIETLLEYNIPCLDNLKNAAKQATKRLHELRSGNIAEQRRFDEAMEGLTAGEQKALLDYLERLRRQRRRNALVEL
jgi:integrase